MSKHTVRDSVHGAVWRLVQQIHDGDVDDSTVYAVRDGELVPAITRRQVRQLSGASSRVITDTIATLVDMQVLYRQAPPERWAFDSKGCKLYGGDMDHEFRVWFVPHVLPTDPEVREQWPDMLDMFAQYYPDGSDVPRKDRSIRTPRAMPQIRRTLRR